jgi:hypothetical protein
MLLCECWQSSCCRRSRNKYPRLARQAQRHQGGFDVEKCISCQYYDRKHAKPSAGGAQQWGQCRRSAPMLNPINAKSYMIEGVWPTVRDDDWCGEWKLLARRVDGRVAEAPNASLISAQSVSPQPRINKLTTMTAAPAHGVAGVSSAAPTITPLVTPSAVAAGHSGND